MSDAQSYAGMESGQLEALRTGNSLPQALPCTDGRLDVLSLPQLRSGFFFDPFFCSAQASLVSELCHSQPRGLSVPTLSPVRLFGSCKDRSSPLASSWELACFLSLCTETQVGRGHEALTARPAPEPCPGRRKAGAPAVGTVAL